MSEFKKDRENGLQRTVVEAEEFVLKDRSGNVRAVLGMTNGEPRLRLTGDGGRCEAAIGIGFGAYPEPIRSGKTAYLSLREHDTPSIVWLAAEAGETRLHCGHATLRPSASLYTSSHGGGFELFQPGTSSSLVFVSCSYSTEYPGMHVVYSDRAGDTILATCCDGNVTFPALEGVIFPLPVKPEGGGESVA
jgi:hypothetical protein